MKQGAPPLDDKWRMILRLVAVGIGYLVYRLLEPRGLGGALCLGFAVWILGSVAVERYGTRRADRSQLPTVGAALLGLGLALLGAYLVLR